MEATSTTLERPRERPRTRLPTAGAKPWIAGISLAGIVLGSLLIVVAATQSQAKYLSPSIHGDVRGWLVWPFATGGSVLAHGGNIIAIEWLLLITLLVMTGFYLVALRLSSSISSTGLWWAVGATYVVLALSPPLLLTDVFNYIGYARMGVLHGLNPYTHIPVQGPDDLVYHLSTWHHLRSPYGPLFTLLTYALVPLGVAGAYWTFKALLVAASIAALLLVARIARRLGQPVAFAVVLVGLNPLVLLFGAGGQHMDMLLLIPVLGAIELSLARRDSEAAASMVAAAFVKASAVLMAPVLIAGAQRRGRALAGALAGLAVCGVVTLLVFGPHLPNVATQGRVVAPYSMPNILGILLGRGGQDDFVRHAMMAVLALSVAACTAWAWRTREIMAPLGWITVASLVTLSWDMAWYLLWLLPFIAFVRSRVFRVAAIAVCVWMTIQWLPLFPLAMREAVGFNPSHTHRWHINGLYEKRLVK